MYFHLCEKFSNIMSVQKLFDPKSIDLREELLAPLIESYRNHYVVDLSDTAANDATLKTLAYRWRVRSFNFSKTDITDAGLVHVGQHKDLRLLDLSHTRVGDEGLKSLEVLKNLLSLDLSDTRVTPSAAKRLAERMPKTKIVHQGLLRDKSMSPSVLVRFIEGFSKIPLPLPLGQAFRRIKRCADRDFESER